MKNSESGYIKVDTEAVVGKDDKPSTWKPTPEQDGEYWTEKALKDSSLKEVYPRDVDNESVEEYEERIRRIAQFAMHDANDRYGDVYVHGNLNEQNKVIRDSSENATPTHKNERGKDVISGHKFVPYTSEKAEGYYEKMFANTLRREWVEDVTNDAKKARETGEIEIGVTTPRDYRKQQELARFYVGKLIHDERVNGKKVEQTGIFEDVGAKYYSEDDRRFVNYKEVDFASRKIKETERVQLIDGKMFEGFFFPLVNQGFFDSSSGDKASFVATSKYDDFKNGADSAVLMPLLHSDQNSEVAPKMQLLCFDLTIGHGDEKIERISKRFKEKCGLTEIKYPTTCLGKLLGDVHDVPHFAICLTRGETELGSFMDEVASGKIPTSEIRDLINLEIYLQASHWVEYWEEQKSPEKAQVFKDIESCFRQRFLGDNDSRQIVEKMRRITRRHPEATKFLGKLNSA